MDLFSQKIEYPENMLPMEGTAKYYGILMPLDFADNYFNRLLKGIEWKNDEAVVYGKRIITKRKVAWYAGQPFEYTYSRTTKRAQFWTDELLQLKSLVEKEAGESFNSCLLNLYHTGSEAMAWHSDGEKDLVKNGAIGSLSFGAERKFSFRHKKTNEKVSLVLEHGSLLVMSGATQTFWQHCLPPTKKVSEPRINLTFRSITQGNGS
ncbi:MAG: alpha-ketoglutarate-dependent dioxygenase AlkB [Alteromonadaceae bacterium]|nr:MAG: alpha-ketoglutarate-dependent dioxygenase AlkB [Alteromonadaceae bacterium]